MAFTCFRRKSSKSSYKLSHEYDRSVVRKTWEIINKRKTGELIDNNGVFIENDDVFHDYGTVSGDNSSVEYFSVITDNQVQKSQTSKDIPTHNHAESLNFRQDNHPESTEEQKHKIVEDKEESSHNVENIPSKNHSWATEKPQSIERTNEGISQEVQGNKNKLAPQVNPSYEFEDGKQNTSEIINELQKNRNGENNFEKRSDDPDSTKTTLENIDKEITSNQAEPTWVTQTAQSIEKIKIISEEVGDDESKSANMVSSYDFEENENTIETGEITTELEEEGSTINVEKFSNDRVNTNTTVQIIVESTASKEDLSIKQKLGRTYSEENNTSRSGAFEENLIVVNDKKILDGENFIEVVTGKKDVITENDPFTNGMDSDFRKETTDVTVVEEKLEMDEENLNKDDSNIFLSVETFASPSSSVSNHSQYEEEKSHNINESLFNQSERYSTDSTLSEAKSMDSSTKVKRRSGVLPKPIHFDEEVAKSLVKYPKSESDEEFIKEAIAKNEFLSKVITGKRLQDVVDAMYKKEIKAKEKVIREGQTGSHMYVAAEGEFEVLKKGKGLVHVTKPGEVFGELAILYNAKRLATVKSSTSAKVWVIDGIVYQQLMRKSNIEEQDEIVSFLQNVPILNEVGVDVLRKVAGLLKPEFFETGTVIVREGDKGDKFYIIAAGSVTITREDNGFIGQLHKGMCFGEKALLESITRQATVTADAPGTECLTLTQKHFINHFGKMEDISKLTMPSQIHIVIEDIKVDNEYSSLDLAKFKILKTLGVGGFGRVEFVQHKEDPSLTFALKYLKKYEMVQQEQQQHVFNEMQIQMACNSPFIIRMYKTFKDNKYIYFLMEVCLGGDLWSLLQKQPNKRFEEKGARFIAACVLEALGYLHERGIVYRDLKPENLLISNNGYIKMTDFGFAKRLAPQSKSGTFAGTPEYVAPEIILNRGHDKAVDYWAYGIFIFELLNGKTPFRSSDPSYMRTYNNILNGLDIVIFPSHNNPKAKSLITKLLKKSPEERLGCLRGGVEDIRNHKWFADFDWKKLRECKIPSPYKPKLISNVDLRYIDHFKRDNDIPPDETSGWDDYF